MKNKKQNEKAAGPASLSAKHAAHQELLLEHAMQREARVNRGRFRNPSHSKEVRFLGFKPRSVVREQRNTPAYQLV